MLWLILISFKAGESVKISFYKKYSTAVPEPSDLCYAASGNSIFMVSDNGLLFETDTTGKIIRESAIRGIDFEGICMANNLLYISDESARKVYCVDPSGLNIIKTFNLQYSAGRNRGFESIVYHPQLKQFYLISEKEPIVIRVYDENFNQVNEYNFNETGDISGAAIYQNQLWLLSDEDHLVMKLDEKMGVVKKFDLKIHNPEGMCFDLSGNLTVLSDDMAKLYRFNAQQLQ
jgi:uncharacterized protein YjiK